MTELAPRVPALLAFPGEIRLQILEEAIAIRRPAPTSPSQSGDRSIYQSHNPLSAKNTNIYVERHDTANDTQMSLLSTNRQLRDETRYVIRRPARMPYQLDVMFVYGFGLIPTWKFLPCLHGSIAELHIHFRIFDFPDGVVPG